MTKPIKIKRTTDDKYHDAHEEAERMRMSGSNAFDVLETMAAQRNWIKGQHNEWYVLELVMMIEMGE